MSNPTLQRNHHTEDLTSRRLSHPKWERVAVPGSGPMTGVCNILQSTVNSTPELPYLQQVGSALTQACKPQLAKCNVGRTQLRRDVDPRGFGFDSANDQWFAMSSAAFTAIFEGFRALEILSSRTRSEQTTANSWLRTVVFGQSGCVAWKVGHGRTVREFMETQRMLLKP